MLCVYSFPGKRKSQKVSGDENDSLQSETLLHQPAQTNDRDHTIVVLEHFLWTDNVKSQHHCVIIGILRAMFSHGPIYPPLYI